MSRYTNACRRASTIEIAIANNHSSKVPPSNSLVSVTSTGDFAIPFGPLVKLATPICSAVYRACVPYSRTPGTLLSFSRSISRCRDLSESRDSLEERSLVTSLDLSYFAGVNVREPLAELMSARPTAADKNASDNASTPSSAACPLDPDLDRDRPGSLVSPTDRSTDRSTGWEPKFANNARAHHRRKYSEAVVSV